MKVAILIAVIILFFPVYRFLRFLFKRIILLAKIKRVCKSQNYGIYGTRPLWFFSTKRTPTCDFYIDTSNTVFAIKLFGVMNRHATLVFTDSREYFVRIFLGVAHIGGLVPLESKAKKLPAYHFRYKYNTDWNIKEPKNILLIHPVCLEIRKKPDRQDEVIIGDTEKICGMTVHSLSRFIGLLSNED